MAGRATFLGYRLLARFAEVLPASAIKPLSRAIARFAIAAFPERRDLVSANLSRVLQRRPSTTEIGAAYASYIQFWFESLRLPVVPTEMLNKICRFDTREHIDSAMAQGKGVILALAHLGNWDVAAAWFVNNGVPLTVVVEELEPPELFTFFKDFRETLGLEVIINDEHVGPKILTALRNERAVALLCDRDVDGTGKPTEMFGATTSIPRGPATLALRSQAPLLPVSIAEDKKGYLISIREPVNTEREGKLRDDVERITAALTARLEMIIAEHPEQWHAVFSPLWADR